MLVPVDVFSRGEGGYSCFRIPSLLKLPTADGSSFALYAEARNKSCSDFAPTDVVYKITRDRGSSWTNLSVLCTDGCSDHDRAYANSTHNPTPVAVAPASGAPATVAIVVEK